MGKKLTFKVFSPILAGATLKDRVLGCIGALVGICVTGFVCGLVFGDHPQLPLIVAPVGASAVLLFAVPASPLAQPWSIVGGNTISALVGVTVVYFIKDPMIAIGLAVSLAILAMSLTRSLHPPGGAAALTAVIGGVAVSRAGFLFPLVPVAINSVLLVVLGTIFHRLAGRQYPHRQTIATVNTHKTSDPPAAIRVGFNETDIEAAISDLNETLDVSRADIDTLLRHVEQRALLRVHGELTCADIMSSDVVSVSEDASPMQAKALLLEHDIRTLPVIDSEKRLLGTVGLRELANGQTSELLPISEAVTAGPDEPAVGLLPRLTDGVAHAVIVVDRAYHVVGVISQTDLLATLGKSLAHNNTPGIMRGAGQGI
ncbi:HPP family protein [Aminobacter aganoensis]|uniref:CBS domain-containing membrane protein n=1 Tax=Aminobacter aganoensis TaxID=83264 RepID=A0A7X0F6M2_9HYPH|nr:MULTISPECIES: HPP family protein [Aminobacter]MBB6353990.1 CBS domain-containing membrane protein [Aminobacter aganoensis]